MRKSPSELWNALQGKFWAYSVRASSVCFRIKILCSQFCHLLVFHANVAAVNVHCNPMPGLGLPWATDSVQALNKVHTAGLGDVERQPPQLSRLWICILKVVFDVALVCQTLEGLVAHRGQDAVEPSAISKEYPHEPFTPFPSLLAKMNGLKILSSVTVVPNKEDNCSVCLTSSCFRPWEPWRLYQTAAPHTGHRGTSEDCSAMEGTLLFYVFKASFFWGGGIWHANLTEDTLLAEQISGAILHERAISLDRSSTSYSLHTCPTGRDPGHLGSSEANSLPNPVWYCNNTHIYMQFKWHWKCPSHSAQRWCYVMHILATSATMPLNA